MSRCSRQASTWARIDSLYSAVKRRRLAVAETSGSGTGEMHGGRGPGGVGGPSAPVGLATLALPALRRRQLRRSRLHSLSV